MGVLVMSRVYSVEEDDGQGFVLVPISGQTPVMTRGFMGGFNSRNAIGRVVTPFAKNYEQSVFSQFLSTLMPGQRGADTEGAIRSMAAQHEGEQFSLIDKPFVEIIPRQPAKNGIEETGQNPHHWGQRFKHPQMGDNSPYNFTDEGEQKNVEDIKKKKKEKEIEERERVAEEVTKKKMWGEAILGQEKNTEDNEEENDILDGNRRPKKHKF